MVHVTIIRFVYLCSFECCWIARILAYQLGVSKEHEEAIRVHVDCTLPIGIAREERCE